MAFDILADFLIWLAPFLYYLDESKILQYFGSTWGPIRHLLMLLPKWWKCWNTQNFEMSSTPDTWDTRQNFLHCFEHGLVTYLTLPDWRGSCNRSEICWTTWLLYCNQLCLPLSLINCFKMLSPCHITCGRTNYYVNNYSEYLPWYELLQSCDTRATKQCVLK